MMLVAVQPSVPGLYCRPCSERRCHYIPPTRSSRCLSRLLCAGFAVKEHLAVLIAVQLFVTGLYLPPVLR